MKPGRRLIEGDDGLPGEEVHVWAIEKHKYLKRYLDISRAVRKKFLGNGNAGATYIDLFCGTGRGRIRETGKWIDGSTVSASAGNKGKDCGRAVRDDGVFDAVEIGDWGHSIRPKGITPWRALGAQDRVLRHPGGDIAQDEQPPWDYI